MASEIFKQRKMSAAQEPVDYVGAFIEDEGKLTLVTVDPSEPWEAFRKLRRTMRRTNKGQSAKLGLFEASAPIEHKADVIELEARRRAG